MKVGYLDDKERAKKAVEETKLIEKYWNDPTHSKTTHRVIIGDSRNMVSVKDNSVHLIITSPPYYNAKEYSQWSTLKDYLEDMKKTFIQCYRVLLNGRKFYLNMSGNWERITPTRKERLNYYFSPKIDPIDEDEEKRREKELKEIYWSVADATKRHP